MLVVGPAGRKTVITLLFIKILINFTTSGLYVYINPHSMDYPRRVTARYSLVP